MSRLWRGCVEEVSRYTSFFSRLFVLTRQNEIANTVCFPDLSVCQAHKGHTPLQARVASKHTKAVRCKHDCGPVHDKVWQQTTTPKRSLYKTGPRPTAGLRHVCMCIQGSHARRAGGIHTKATLHCAVRTAQGSARLYSGCHLRRCNRRQGAAPRSWRPRLQEQKVWSARGEAGAATRREGGVHTAWRAGSGPAEAARQAGMWGRRGEKGFSHRRSLAGSCLPADNR